MPAVTVDTVEEPSGHLATVFAFGFLVFEAARIERNDGGADAEFVAAQGVGVFGVIGLVGEDAIKVNVLGSLFERRREVGDVVAGSAGSDGAGDEVGMGVTNNGEFGPMSLLKGAGFRAPIEVMGAGVTRIQARRIDGALGLLVDQVQAACAFEYSFEQDVESPFFSSLFSAWQRVE